jgi:hypothetical protein
VSHFSVHSPSDVMLHDLENVGDTMLRFVTVELSSSPAEPS